jgi:hypothetical protein
MTLVIDCTTPEKLDAFTEALLEFPSPSKDGSFVSVNLVKAVMSSPTISPVLPVRAAIIVYSGS